MTKIKVALLIIILSSLAGCGKQVPEFPEVNQCAYSVRFDKFRCCNSRTGVCVNLRRDDPVMEAAQCLSADDYKKSEAWVESVKQIAETRCK